jgi:Zn-dependent oligopeptidase
MLDKLMATMTFQTANSNLTQLRYALLDMNYHLANPQDITDVDAFEKQVLKHTVLLPSVQGTNTSCSFSHIFAGGYSAGYYSYKWAEALEADAWSLIKEKGIFNQEVTFPFRKLILSKGNSVHPMELFVAFRGRKPDPDAMLKRDGLI